MEVDGKIFTDFDAKSIRLKPKATPGVMVVSIGLGPEKVSADSKLLPPNPSNISKSPNGEVARLLPGYQPKSGILPTSEMLQKLENFEVQLSRKGFQESYELSHIRLILESAGVIRQRVALKLSGKLVLLPEVSQTAADQLYLDTLTKLYAGLVTQLEKNLSSEKTQDRQIAELWREIR